MKDTWFGILACSLVGSALAIAGFVRLVVLAWLRSNGVRAIGRVVRLERARYTTTGQLPYTPVAEFEANGRQYEARGSACVPPLYREGDSVPVYYPRDRPRPGPNRHRTGIGGRVARPRDRGRLRLRCPSHRPTVMVCPFLNRAEWRDPGTPAHL